MFYLKLTEVVDTEEEQAGTVMARNNAYQLDPWPLESSILTEKRTLRSQDIWEGNDNMILNTRRCDGKFWNLIKEYPTPPRVLEVIQLAGLYGIYRSQRPVIDRSLITSLVERWCPETLTFHFRTGEATITLQDVEVLYGLPVNGHPVLGNEPTRTIGDRQNICQRLLGFIPSPQDFICNNLKVTALNAHMLRQPQLPDMATQDMVNQKARCYMFWKIASMMMTDTSGNSLKLMYLPMLEDVIAIGSYSWGSATLVCLYRFLCKASQSNQNEILVFLPLLQIWAWERVTVLRPQVTAQRDTRDIFLAGLPRGPHATRWFAHFSWTNTTKNVLKVFRDALDSMTEDQFIWEPYSDDLIESLPDYCRIGRDIWRVRASNFLLMISTPFAFDFQHFHHDRRGRPNTNWELEHAQWLPLWNQQHQNICDAPVNHEPLQYDDPYLIWFRRITRLVIGNPTSHCEQQEGYMPNSIAYEIMVHYIHSMVDQARSLGDQPSMEDFYLFCAMVRNEGERCLAHVDEADRVRVQANYRRDEVQTDHSHPSVRRRGKGGVTGRRERAIERGRVAVEMDEAASEDEQTTCDIGSFLGGHTHEFTPGVSGMTYQPTNTEIVPYMTPQISRDPSLSSLNNVFGGYRSQYFENAPNFTSSPVPMSTDILDIEGNELDDSNDEVENESEGGEPSVKENRTIFPKRCGTGSHYLYQHAKKKNAKGNKE